MKGRPRLRRTTGELSAEKLLELRAARREILETERPAITARANVVRRQVEQARAELSRAVELLHAEREGQGVSLSELQARTGIARTALCRLENLVEANPTVATLERIAEGLGKRLVIALEDR